MKNESADATHQAMPAPSSNVKTAAATSQSRLVEIVIAVMLVAICMHLIGNCCSEMRLQTLRDFDRLPSSQQPNFSVSFLSEAMQTGDLTTKIAAINVATCNRQRCGEKVLMIAATDPDRRTQHCTECCCGTAIPSLSPPRSISLSNSRFRACLHMLQRS